MLIGPELERCTSKSDPPLIAATTTVISNPAPLSKDNSQQ